MGIAAELCIFTNDRITIAAVEASTGSESTDDAGQDAEAEAAAEDEE
jgi:hypothetical protein